MNWNPVACSVSVRAACGGGFVVGVKLQVAVVLNRVKIWQLLFVLHVIKSLVSWSSRNETRTKYMFRPLIRCLRHRREEDTFFDGLAFYGIFSAMIGLLHFFENGNSCVCLFGWIEASINNNKKPFQCNLVSTTKSIAASVARCIEKKESEIACSKY